MIWPFTAPLVLTPLVTLSRETVPALSANARVGATPLATLAINPSDAKESFCRRLKVPRESSMEKVPPAASVSVAPAVPAPAVPALITPPPGLTEKVPVPFTVIAVFTSTPPEASDSVPAETVVVPV